MSPADIERPRLFSPATPRERVSRLFPQYSFAGALHASMLLKDHDLAMDLLEETVAMGMPANTEGWATGIRTCARCGKVEEALYLYAKQLRMTIVPSKVCLRCTTIVYWYGTRCCRKICTAALFFCRSFYLHSGWLRVLACLLCLPVCQYDTF